jgi:hypothetical protein
MAAGPLGPDGPLGPNGPEGPDGPDGPETPEGPEGPLGPDAPDGPEGPDTPEGPDGPEGPRHQTARKDRPRRWRPLDLTGRADPTVLLARFCRRRRWGRVGPAALGDRAGRRR